MICFKTSLLGQVITDSIPHNIEELKKEILSLKKSISTISSGMGTINSTLRASSYSGMYLKKASKNYFTGLAFNIIGSAILTVGASSNNGEVIMILGGGAVLAGFISHISAWANIKKAGKLQAQSYI